MKYVKSYKLFESKGNQILEYIKDILVDLEDDGYLVNVIMYANDTKIQISITNMGDIEDLGNKTLYDISVKLGKYVDDIIRLKEYMETTQFKFGKIEFETDSDYISNIEEDLYDMTEHELLNLIRKVDDSRDDITEVTIVFSKVEEFLI